MDSPYGGQEPPVHDLRIGGRVLEASYLTPLLTEVMKRLHVDSPVRRLEAVGAMTDDRSSSIGESSSMARSRTSVVSGRDH